MSEFERHKVTVLLMQVVVASVVYIHDVFFVARWRSHVKNWVGEGRRWED